MPAVSYNRISAFLRIWENAIENIEDVFFVPSFDNLIKLSLTQLESKTTVKVKRDEKGYRWKLLRTIEADLRRRIIIISIMRLECKNEFDDLKTELAEPTFDMAKIYPLLQRVALSPSEDLLRREISRILVSAQRLDKDRLAALVQLLVRQISTRFSISELKSLPRQVLARQHVKSLMASFIRELTDHIDIREQCDHVLHEVYFSATRDPSSMIPHEAKGSDQALWYLISDLPHLLSTQINLVLAGNVSPADPIEILLSDKTSLRTIGLQMIECYLRTMLTVSFRSIGWSEDQSQDSRFETLSSSIEDVVLRVGDFRDNKQPGTAIGSVVQNPVAESLLAKPIADVLAARCLLNYRSTDWEELAQNLGYLILTIVRDDVIHNAINWLETPSDQITMLLFACSAKRSLQSAITDLLEPLRAFAIAQIAILPKASTTVLNNDEMQQFWSVWSTVFEDHVMSNPMLFDYLPWDMLSVSEFRKSIKFLFQEFFCQERKSIVILRVPNKTPYAWLSDGGCRRELRHLTRFC
jgi:hypothetical protein